MSPHASEDEILAVEAEIRERCRHQWEWVQPRIVTIGDEQHRERGEAKSYNARCTRCGETTWAHGWNVTAPTHPGPRDPVLEQEC